jgi:glycyl-tRNA synthetase beta chain
MFDRFKGLAQAVDQVMDFLRQRLEALWESEGYRFDEIRAVLAAGLNDVVDADARIAALKEMRSQADFAALAGAFKRASNILRQAEKNKVSVPGLVNEQLFTEASEKDLYEGVRRMESEIQALLEKCDYRPALQKMVSVKPAVDAFFDNVMVMAEDQQVRANRLAILNYINKLFFKILDFSQLQG